MDKSNSKKSADTEQIREENTNIIIDTLRIHKAMARVDLARISGLSPATITTITAHLINEGLLREVNSSSVKSTGPGRPRILIDLNPLARLVVGVKISIDQLILSIGNLKGDIQKQKTVVVPTLSLNAGELIKVIIRHIEDFIKEAKISRQKLWGIGLAAQGFVNVNDGVIAWSVALSQKNIEIKGPLQKYFKLPVEVENDANCIAHSILKSPEINGCRDFAVVMLGYGVGMGLIVGDKLYRGTSGAAAEIGHSKFSTTGPLCNCGRNGCIEAYVGDYAIYRRGLEVIKSRALMDTKTIQEGINVITREAADGNPDALGLFTEIGHVLGFGLANLIALFNPSKIFITGSGVSYYAYMEKAIHAGIRDNLVFDLCKDVQIVSIPWDEDYTIKGINAISIDRVLSNREKYSG